MRANDQCKICRFAIMEHWHTANLRRGMLPTINHDHCTPPCLQVCRTYASDFIAVRVAAGRKMDLPANLVEVWGLLQKDIHQLTIDDGAETRSVDDCVQCVIDSCFAEIGVSVDSDVVMSNLCHVCPHVLEPCRAACLVFRLAAE